AGHLVIVVEENSDYSDVIGNTTMPYLNGLAQQYALATQYYADTHPSIGNYFELATGQILTNDDGSSTIENVDNIVRELVAAGKPRAVAPERDVPDRRTARHRVRRSRQRRHPRRRAGGLRAGGAQGETGLPVVHGLSARELVAAGCGGARAEDAARRGGERAG